MEMSSVISCWQVTMTDNMSSNIIMNIFSGTTHPYPDDTFYSVGRVPRKLLMKYLGIKMYLVRLKHPPPPLPDWRHCNDVTQLLASVAQVAIASPEINRKTLQETQR